MWTRQEWVARFWKAPTLRAWGLRDLLNSCSCFDDRYPRFIAPSCFLWCFSRCGGLLTKDPSKLAYVHGYKGWCSMNQGQHRRTLTRNNELNRMKHGKSNETK